MLFFYFFFFNDTATTEIYTLSLHDALPICYVEQRLPDRHLRVQDFASHDFVGQDLATGRQDASNQWLADRKSTRLNSSHLVISYAVFCLKKKKKHHM